MFFPIHRSDIHIKCFSRYFMLFIYMLCLSNWSLFRCLCSVLKLHFSEEFASSTLYCLGVDVASLVIWSLLCAGLCFRAVCSFHRHMCAPQTFVIWCLSFLTPLTIFRCLFQHLKYIHDIVQPSPLSSSRSFSLS